MFECQQNFSPVFWFSFVWNFACQVKATLLHSLTCITRIRVHTRTHKKKRCVALFFLWREVHWSWNREEQFLFLNSPLFASSLTQAPCLRKCVFQLLIAVNHFYVQNFVSFLWCTLVYTGEDNAMHLCLVALVFSSTADSFIWRKVLFPACTYKENCSTNFIKGEMSFFDPTISPVNQTLSGVCVFENDESVGWLPGWTLPEGTEVVKLVFCVEMGTVLFLIPLWTTGGSFSAHPLQNAILRRRNNHKQGHKMSTN